MGSWSELKRESSGWSPDSECGNFGADAGFSAKSFWTGGIGGIEIAGAMAVLGRAAVDILDFIEICFHFGGFLRSIRPG